MATTGRGITYPTTANNITPLATHFANLATSADTAIGALQSLAGVTSVANATARNALFPSPVDGNAVYRLDTDTIEVYNGTVWLSNDLATQAWTPTTSGITVGNGVLNAWYQRQGATINWSLAFKLGSTSAVAGPVKFNLPIANVVQLNVGSNGAFDIIGKGTFHQPGVLFGNLTAIASSTATPQVEVFADSALFTYVGYTGISNTAPVTWANNGGFHLTGSYRIV